MGTNFPGSVDTFTEPGTPTATALGSAGSGSRVHSVHHRDLGDAIEAMQKRIVQGQNVKMHGAVGDGSHDDTTAIQAAIDAVETTFVGGYGGGCVYFPPGRYRITTGLTVTHIGTYFLGAGHPGVSPALADGVSQILSEGGITAIECDIGSHSNLGFVMEKLYVAPSDGSGNGLRVGDVMRVILRDVTFGGYIAGYGVRLDGESGNAQYAHFDNVSCGDCMTGVDLIGTGPNGLVMLGGYFEGQGTNPRDGSVGVNLATGDTLRVYGTNIQGYETGVYVQPAGAQATIEPRIEYCNIGVRIGSAVSTGVFVGGSYDNSLLTGGGASVSIQVDAGASGKIVLAPVYNTAGMPIADNSGNAIQPFSKPTVTGSRGGNAALASLLSALATQGLITNSTS